MKFVKIHGLANDFIVLEQDDSVDYPGLARRLCLRHTGVGADGLLVVKRLEEGWQMKIFNADGSEAEMSGNGIRCVAAFICHKYGKTPSLDITTPTGKKTLKLISNNNYTYQFQVTIGKPTFTPSLIPIALPDSLERVIDYPVQLPSGQVLVTALSVGNPHCCVFVEDFNFDWKTIGTQLEQHPLFPSRTNVEFIRKTNSSTSIEVRLWERGVGITASSGTGASAAAMAAILKGLVTPPVKVEMPAGTLTIALDSDEQLCFQGPAEIVFEGSLCDPKST
ncbi:MAG: diaminopimelate epimerase [Acidobacteriota bacterium]|nr:diaminopimelate epimerase [Blastocatellia bacterium]MDW8412478.1 diaminopimelate epimerase [Acidobacteriota bacterium]